MRIDNRGAKIAGLLVFASICLSIFAYLFVAAGGHIRLHRPYHANAMVPTAFQLVKNADIRSAGVKVGVISDIQNVGDEGKVEFEITDKHFPVYRDAAVQVRTKTLVGENYLEITPGTPRAGKLEEGGTLPLAQAKDAVQLDQILDSLGPRTRERVQANLDGLGPGFAGRGPELNRLWAAVKPNSEDGGVVMRVLSGQRRQLAALVNDTGNVMQALGDRTQQVRVLARQARTAAQAAAGRDAELSSAIRELAPTLTQAKGSVTRLGGFATRSTGTISGLADVAGKLRPVVAALRPAMADTRRLFAVLPAALASANPLLARLTPLATDLTPAVNGLDLALRQAGPTVGYLKPFAAEIGSMLANNGSVFATKDAVGTKGRVHAVLSAGTVAAFNDDEKKLLKALMQAGGGGILNSERMNPYPKPGDVAHPTDGDGHYSRVQPTP